MFSYTVVFLRARIEFPPFPVPSNVALCQLKKKYSHDLWTVCGGPIRVCHFMKIQCQNEETVFPTKKAQNLPL